MYAIVALVKKKIGEKVSFSISIIPGLTHLSSYD
jgi:hypothetical protein